MATTARKANGGATKRSGSAAGSGVDAFGDPVFDPSENVKALSEAANKRQDDLRAAGDRLTDSRIAHIESMMALVAGHTKEINDAESRRVDEQLKLRAEYEERLGQAEAKRIDAIRAVDVNAVAVASQRASDQATVLATQVAQSAEALRSLVASTAVTVNQSQQQLATTLSTRITTLEQAQYEGKGRSTFADPAFAELLNEVKSLRDSRAVVTGKSEGISATVAILIAVGGLLLAGLGYLATRPTTPTAPIVIEVPSATPTTSSSTPTTTTTTVPAVR